MSAYDQPEGASKDGMAPQFELPAYPTQASQAASTTASSMPAETNPPVIGSAPPSQAAFGPVILELDQIKAPAFFVDQQLSLRWIAPDGKDAFSQVLTREWEIASTRNIFSFLLRPAIKGAISDWQAFFSFVYILLRRSTPKKTFDAQATSVSMDHVSTAIHKPSPPPDTHPFQVDSCLIGGVDADNEFRLRVFGMEFAEGTLFLIRMDPWHPSQTDDQQQDFTAGTIDSVDQKRSIGLLSARLHDAHRIADMMLPDLFFKLMCQICEEGDDLVHSLGGARAGSNGAEVQYLFSESAGRNPIFSAICCAARLKKRMKTLQKRLKAEQGWSNEICLNMGISHGMDDRSVHSPVGSMELSIPGGAPDQSSLLSTIAAKGEIWITKNAVGQLPKKRIDQLVLGIDRQGQFLRNFFTRTSDLQREIGSILPKQDMGSISITRMVSMEAKQADKGS